MTELTDIGLPNNWIIAKLSDMVIDPKSDFVDGPFGSNLKADEYRDEGVPVFRIQNIKAGYFLDKNIQFVTPQKAEQIKRHSFKFGDIIITKLGEPLGLCCKVPAKYPSGIIVADLMRVRPSDIIVNTDYLVYAVNSKLIQDQFKRITKGTTRARVNLTIVRDIVIPLAPLNEQNRIVDKLDELLSELEKGKEQLQTSLEQLKVYRQSILKHAFEGKMTNENVKQGELPKDWKWVNLIDILKNEKHSLKAGPFGSALKKDSYVSKGYKVYGQEQVISNNPFLGNYFINESKYKQLESCKIQPFDILISLVGTIGKVLVLPSNCEKGIINPRLIKITLDQNKYLPKFFKYYFESSLVKENYSKQAKGTTMDVLNLGIIKRIPFPCTSITEQQKLIEKIEYNFSLCDNLEISVRKTLNDLNSLQKSLLQKAFEGKLVEQDPTDEPASILLERIKKEREEYLKAEKGRKNIKMKVSI